MGSNMCVVLKTIAFGTNISDENNPIESSSIRPGTWELENRVKSLLLCMLSE